MIGGQNFERGESRVSGSELSRINWNVYILYRSILWQRIK